MRRARPAREEQSAPPERVRWAVRLPNGNILVTYSVAGIIHEIDPSGQLVATYRVEGSQFGYTEFRETLYGPPPYRS